MNTLGPIKSVIMFDEMFDSSLDMHKRANQSYVNQTVAQSERENSVGRLNHQCIGSWVNFKKKLYKRMEIEKEHCAIIIEIVPSTDSFMNFIRYMFHNAPVSGALVNDSSISIRVPHVHYQRKDINVGIYNVLDDKATVCLVPFYTEITEHEYKIVMSPTDLMMKLAFLHEFSTAPARIRHYFYMKLSQAMNTDVHDIVEMMKETSEKYKGAIKLQRYNL